MQWYKKYSLNRFLYFYILFYCVFGVFLYNALDWSLIDEFSVFFILACLFRIRKLCRNREFIFFVLLYIFYLTYSLIRKVNPSLLGVILDSLQQIKPYLFFYSIYAINPQFTQSNKKYICKISLILSIAAFLLIVISGNLFFCFGHPTHYYNLLINYALLYFYFSDFTFKNRKITLLIILLGLISLKGKLYGEIVSFFCFLFCVKRKIKINLRTVIYAIILILLTCYLIWDRINLYIISGVDEENGIARALLYLRIPQILSDYFPFGPGFGTYANYFSGEYYSPLYEEYGLHKVWGMQEGEGLHNFIADAYYPQLVQYGFVGFLCFILFWKRRYYNVVFILRRTGSIKSYVFFCSLLVYILIECSTAPTIQTNLGLIPMFLLAVQENQKVI